MHTAFFTVNLTLARTSGAALTDLCELAGTKRRVFASVPEGSNALFQREQAAVDFRPLHPCLRNNAVAEQRRFMLVREPVASLPQRHRLCMPAKSHR